MDTTESLERARADVEMLLAAFEAEIHNIIKDNNNNNPSTHHQFPFQVTFQFSPTASCVIEWRDGYPAVPLRIVSSRSSSLQEKLRLETALVTFRQHAEECHQQQMEAGLTCCSAALEAWNEYNPNNHVQQQQQEQQQQSTMPTAETNHYPWITGEPIVDRKSSFQAHLCPIESEQDVQPALLQLLHSSTKLQRATHNMYAWRVCHDGVWKHDNNDDGEDAAGSRLAHLLSVRNENGVLVVVSRWFGGIHLGPKRFAHITNAARQLLDDYRNS